jgi:hypothetical protein
MIRSYHYVESGLASRPSDCKSELRKGREKRVRTEVRYVNNSRKVLIGKNTMKS